MIDFWFLTEEYLFMCLVLECSVWSMVLYIHRCSGSFCPYMHGKILIMKHFFSASMIVLFFLSATPLCCGLYGVVNSLLIPESLHNSLNSFDVNSPPLSDQKFLILFSMCFSIKALNSLNLLKNFIFVLYEVNPCLPKKVIKERNIVYIPT